MVGSINNTLSGQISGANTFKPGQTNQQENNQQQVKQGQVEQGQNPNQTGNITQTAAGTNNIQQPSQSGKTFTLLQDNGTLSTQDQSRGQNLDISV